jgi:hypothetical protein
MVPLPVKYRIHFGEPMRFGNPSDEDDVIAEKVDQVKGIAAMLADGLAARRSLFW